MIWCIIFVVALIVGIVFTVIDGKKDINWMAWVGITLMIVGGLATCIGGCVVALDNLNQEANLTRLNAKKEAIEYQIENDLDMADVLVEFNSEVEYVHKMRESNWTNWFYGAYWDEIEAIELK